jgi:hypothetical protein
MEQRPSSEAYSQESLQLVKKLHSVYETRRFINMYTRPANRLGLELDESSLHYFLKIHFNIILPSTPRFSEWSQP